MGVVEERYESSDATSDRPRLPRMSVSAQIVGHAAGTVPGAGSYACIDCDAAVVLTALDALPECPTCGGSSFRRASLFEHTAPQETPTIEDLWSGPQGTVNDWLDEVRGSLQGSGQFIAFQSDGGVTIRSLEQGWTRIGRSAAADLQLDDPTVSRRHALIVCEDGKARVLDDRSLNGVFVNGEQVEWGELTDGDEIAVGRYRLFFIDA
jgi:hypothetical protein